MVETRQRYELGVADFGGALPGRFVDRIGSPSVAQNGHSDLAHHVGKSLGDQPLLPTGNQRGRIVCQQTLAKLRRHPLTQDLDYCIRSATQRREQRIFFPGSVGKAEAALADALPTTKDATLSKKRVSRQAERRPFARH
jgi:hypothetical protein